jgi:hypothetical protein
VRGPEETRRRDEGNHHESTRTARGQV